MNSTYLPDPDYALYGGNHDAFYCGDEEVLLAGPAGTGKSLTWLLKLYWTCRDHAGARCLIVRKTRESLTESVLVTWERDVLGPDHPVLTRHPVLRRVRQSYLFPNGSIVVLGGMDKPDKVLSSEWDLIYVPEAIELTITDWETLGGRLRAGRVTRQQILADCNPTTPTHWIYRRCQVGLCRLIVTTHEDNPRYYDRAAGRWTPEGERYLARLGRMTGARRKRFLEGVWESAEGLVYDGYDPTVHLLPAGWEPPADWPRVWSLDWGYNPAPIVLQFWALDPENRMYLYRETYRTRQTVRDLGEWARGEIERGDEPKPIAVVSDHETEKAAVFAATTGRHVIPAEKFDKLAGIQQVQQRFDRQPDGLPRIFFRPDARRHEPDPFLVEAGKPASTLEELTGYVWDTRNPDRPRDVPLDLNDHGMDALLYACRQVSLISGPSMYASDSTANPYAGLLPGTFGPDPPVPTAGRGGKTDPLQHLFQ